MSRCPLNPQCGQLKTLPLGLGTLFLQSRSTQAFLSWLIPRLPTRTGGGGTAGGILGNILSGD